MDKMEPLRLPEKRLAEIEVVTDTSVIVLINGTETTFQTEWLVGEGRASDTPLAKMILGTEQGLQSSTNIEIDESLEVGLDTMRIWLHVGNENHHLLEDKGKVPALKGLADFFGLTSLKDEISAEQERVRLKFDEFDVSKNFARLRSSGQARLVTSTGNLGAVLSGYFGMMRYGFIIDKDTREKVFFHVDSAIQEDEGDTELEMGVEVVFDLQVSKHGKKPGIPKAINIKPLYGRSFKRIRPPIMI